jgi:hypothetical protein
LVIRTRDNPRMAKALALATVQPLFDPVEVLRCVFVVGCALSLILAGQALPSGW